MTEVEAKEVGLGYPELAIVGLGPSGLSGLLIGGRPEVEQGTKWCIQVNITNASTRNTVYVAIDNVEIGFHISDEGVMRPAKPKRSYEWPAFDTKTVNLEPKKKRSLSSRAFTITEPPGTEMSIGVYAAKEGEIIGSNKVDHALIVRSEEEIRYKIKVGKPVPKTT